MNNNELQRNYYETNLNKPAMQAKDSKYVKRHLDRMIELADLSVDKSLLEVGSGLGKFTLPLLERGYDPVCLDISPIMLERIKENAAPYQVETILSDVAEASKHTVQRFERAIGFFTLHHMSDLTKSLQGLNQVLLPGAKAAFCEPRAYNPLYYLQIFATPGMSWKAEKGIVNMRKSYMLSAIREAGLKPVKVVSYGFFPPFIMNKDWGSKLNDVLEKKHLLSFAHAFQVFIIEKPR